MYLVSFEFRVTIVIVFGVSLSIAIYYATGKAIIPHHDHRDQYCMLCSGSINPKTRYRKANTHTHTQQGGRKESQFHLGRLFLGFLLLLLGFLLSLQSSADDGLSWPGFAHVTSEWLPTFFCFSVAAFFASFSAFFTSFLAIHSGVSAGPGVLTFSRWGE